MLADNNVKYRQEMKYIITLPHALVIKNRLSRFLPRDKHADISGKYAIRSLYFDTPENKAFHEKIEGLPLKEKFRIRLYNYDYNLLRLEKKIKHYGKGIKLRSTLSTEEVKKILNGEIFHLKYAEDSLLKEFYVRMLYERFMPKVVIDYKREAYFYPVGNVRVCFDSDIRASINSTDIFDINLPTAPVFDDAGICVLEVKYDGFLPEHIQDVIQLNNCTSTAISKYVAGRIYM